MISALSGSITHVRAEEFSDIRTYGAPDVVRDWMLFGKTPEEAPDQHHGRRARCRLPPVGLHGGRRARASTSTRNCGRPTRWPSPPRRSTRRSGRSSRGPSPRSASSGRRLVDGEPVITAAVNWLMGEEHLDPAWKFGPERRALRGRGHRRSELPHDLQEAAPRDRSRPASSAIPGIVATAHALRQRDPVRVRGRARPAHLPRPAAGGRPGRSGLAGPAGAAAMILDRFRPRRPGRRSSPGPGLGIGRGIAIGLAEAGRRRGAGRPHRRPTSTRWPASSGDRAGGRSSCPPT